MQLHQLVAILLHKHFFTKIRKMQRKAYRKWIQQSIQRFLIVLNFPWSILRRDTIEFHWSIGSRSANLRWLVRFTSWGHILPFTFLVIFGLYWARHRIIFKWNTFYTFAGFNFKIFDDCVALRIDEITKDVERFRGLKIDLRECIICNVRNEGM